MSGYRASSMTRRQVPNVKAMFLPSGDQVGVSDWNDVKTRVVPPVAGADARNAEKTCDLKSTSPRAVTDGSYVSRSKCVSCDASPVPRLRAHKSSVPFALGIL